MQRLFLLGFMLCISMKAHAQSQEKNWKLSSDGYLEQDHVSFFKGIPDTDQHIDESSAQIAVNLKYKNLLTFSASARGIFNSQFTGRRRIFLNEIFAVWQKNQWKIKAGKYIIDWGNTLGFSQGDVQNRLSYYDFLDRENEDLGVWAFTGTYSWKKSGLELTISPYTERSRFFTGKTRWLTLPSTFVNPLNPSEVLPTQTSVIGDEQSFPNPQFSLLWKISGRRFDWSFRYFYGWNMIPNRRITVGDIYPNQKLNLTLRLSNETLNMFTAAFSTYLGAWNVWGEIYGRQTEKISLNNGITNDIIWQTNLGIDRMFLFPNNQEQNLQLLMQYIYTHSFEGNEYSNLEFDLIFQHALIFALNYQLSYKWKLETLQAYEIRFKGYYSHFDIQYSPIPSIKLILGTDLLYGNENSFFGSLRDNKRIQFKLRYLF